MATFRAFTALLVFAVAGPAHGQQPALLPFVGETTAEYEKRLRGGLSSSAPGPFAVPRPDGRTVTVYRNRNGQFFVEGAIDGVRVPMLVDTGASLVALSYRDAETAGVLPPAELFTQVVETANGPLKAAPVVLRRLRVGTIELREVDALVLPQGGIDRSLLGMNFLGRIRAVFIADGQLLMRN